MNERKCPKHLLYTTCNQRLDRTTNYVERDMEEKVHEAFKAQEFGSLCKPISR